MINYMLFPHKFWTPLISYLISLTYLAVYRCIKITRPCTTKTSLVKNSAIEFCLKLLNQSNLFLAIWLCRIKHKTLSIMPCKYSLLFPSLLIMQWLIASCCHRGPLPLPDFAHVCICAEFDFEGMKFTSTFSTSHNGKYSTCDPKIVILYS